MEIIRATKTAEQDGAYYVRIQAMARKIHFYETMGYVADCSQKIVGDTFTCYRMEKELPPLHVL